jgi:hypothetical protein
MLEQHLGECDECSTELDDMRKLHVLVSRGEMVGVDDQLLAEARHQLRAALRIERSRQTLWNRISDRMSAFSTLLPSRNWGLALGSIAMVGCGILIGRLVFPPSSPGEGSPLADSDLKISNVRFLNPDTNEDELEFSFEAVKPMRVKGTIHDERIQKVLTYALLNEQNPGVRLRAINTMAGPSTRTPDREMKAALIIALRSDDNAGVRKEALVALRKFPFDAEVRDALLDALMHDKNPGIRIAAINGLDSARTLGPGSDQSILDVLKQKVNSDDNNYIRLRAKTVLQEVKEQ